MLTGGCLPSMISEPRHSRSENTGRRARARATSPPHAEFGFNCFVFGRPH